MVRRFWDALVFALLAFRFHWAHGALAMLIEEPTVLQFVGTPVTAMVPVLAAVPVAAPPVSQPADLDRPEYAAIPFVVEVVGYLPVYSGSSGGAATRNIELLRAETPEPEWLSFRFGKRWDWGPR